MFQNTLIYLFFCAIVYHKYEEILSFLYSQKVPVTSDEGLSLFYIVRCKQFVLHLCYDP